MNCPNCKIELIDNEQQGLEVDYCPACQGVWLDSRQLDRFIAPPTMAKASIRIPSVSSQKQDNFEIIYDGSETLRPMKTG